MADDDEDPTLEKAEGTKVEWKPSKNVTVKLMRKKQKAKRGGGQRTIEKEEAPLFALLGTLVAVCGLECSFSFSYSHFWHPYSLCTIGT